ncbi:MAG: polyprenyl synthetase family protein [Flavobacteriales bacterium]|nr:polyprenyl synthetase family protein [Flavobacteriales bacterium]
MDGIKGLQKLFDTALDALEFPSEPKSLYEPISYTLANGGKRMRPLLVLLGCRIFSRSVEEAIHPAIGIELFHNFTLLHDDIMDNAPLRRGKKTVHEKWNNHVAILAGDATFIIAYQELMQTRPEVLADILTEFNRTALEICEGQQLDMDFETHENVSIDDYLHMISLKTAVLLGASLKIGAIIGGANAEQAQLLYDFGLNAGIAFQLQDDMLDVYGESHKVGKQKGGDIISSKKTFLLLKAMELAEGKESNSLTNWIESDSDLEKVSAITDIYDRLGIRKLAEERMWDYYNKGISSLDKVKGDDEWIAILRAFSEKLMHRES